MVESVKVLPDEFQDLIELQVWNVKERQGIEKKAALGAKCIPAIAINNQVVFESVIPPREDLIAAIKDRQNC